MRNPFAFWSRKNRRTREHIDAVLPEVFSLMSADPEGVGSRVPAEALPNMPDCMFEQAADVLGVCGGGYADYLKPRVTEDGYAIQAQCCDAHSGRLTAMGFVRIEEPIPGT